MRTDTSASALLNTHTHTHIPINQKLASLTHTHTHTHRYFNVPSTGCEGGQTQPRRRWPSVQQCAVCGGAWCGKGGDSRTAGTGDRRQSQRHTPRHPQHADSATRTRHGLVHARQPTPQQADTHHSNRHIVMHAVASVSRKTTAKHSLHAPHNIAARSEDNLALCPCACICGCGRALHGTKTTPNCRTE